MSDTIFLTGSTGFIGASIARRILDRGFNLRALVRPDSNRSNVEDLAIDLVEGNLTDPESYRHALKDCRYLIHTAADYRIWVPDPADMNRTNIEGTSALMQAALDANIERIVYTSSVATLGLRGDGSSSSEDTPVSYNDMVGVYKQSKFRAEEEVKRLIDHYGLPAVIVNPSTPIGPRDIKPTPTGQIIVNAMQGLMPAYVDTGLNVVHVDDVAEGHLLALERGKIGERYILGGDNMSLSEILTAIAEIGGHAPPKIKLPRTPLYPIAYAMEFIARLTGWKPLITVDALRMSEKKMWFSSAKAENDLGYVHRPAREALLEAIEWFQEQWYC
ncbi:MAG: NAD-dependent epimerase/dehydratase family protein [Alphaproteobacteria bacterium]|nr:NAD-dependent epimerase/dehydratase family protein [Alphaproteobacteria bacterium]